MLFTHKKCANLKSLNCVVTPGYTDIFRDFFEPSLGGFPLQRYDIDVASNKFGSKEFLEVIYFKIDHIIKSLEGSEEEAVIWSDIDLFFTQPAERAVDLALAEMGNCHLAFSPERKSGNEINTGFFVARCTQENRKFFKSLRREIVESKKTEQPTANRMLSDVTNKAPKWKVLSKNFWNATVGFPIPQTVRMVHANFTPLILPEYRSKVYAEQKYEALEFLARKHAWWR